MDDFEATNELSAYKIYDILTIDVDVYGCLRKSEDCRREDSNLRPAHYEC